MRTSALVSVASLALAICATPLEPLADPAAWDQAAQGERIVPRLDQSEPIDGGKRVERLYGPYTVPAGKMQTWPKWDENAPCEDCYVTAMFATLKFADGKEATTKEGLWMHHITLGSAKNFMIWAAGNERPTIRLNSQHKYGIDWGKGIRCSVDINNEKAQPVTTFLSITFEYVPKQSDIGKQYKGSVMRWIGLSRRREMPKPGKTIYNSQIMTSDVSGKLLYTIGHMHDGGTNLRLFINNKPVCDSIMYYDGGDKGLVKGSDWVGTKNATTSASGHGAMRRSPQEGHGHQESMSGPHIASPGACTNYGTVSVNDAMRTESYYDFDKFEMQEHGGSKEALMGNCRVYIGPD